jgi:hypothetical protein
MLFDVVFIKHHFWLPIQLSYFKHLMIWVQPKSSQKLTRSVNSYLVKTVVWNLQSQCLRHCGPTKNDFNLIHCVGKPHNIDLTHCLDETIL